MTPLSWYLRGGLLLADVRAQEFPVHVVICATVQSSESGSSWSPASHIDGENGGATHGNNGSASLSAHEKSPLEGK